MNSVCNRCPAYAECLLNYGSKACYNLADSYGFNAKPTRFDRIKDMDIDELVEFLSDIMNCEINIKQWLESEVEE